MAELIHQIESIPDIRIYFAFRKRDLAAIASNEKPSIIVTGRLNDGERSFISQISGKPGLLKVFNLHRLSAESGLIFKDFVSKQKLGVQSIKDEIRTICQSDLINHEKEN